MDEMDRNGNSKEKFICYFRVEKKWEVQKFTIRTRLIDYGKMDPFMEQLIQYENLNIEMHDRNLSFDAGEEIQ